jgi:hypothetical protein
LSRVAPRRITDVADKKHYSRAVTFSELIDSSSVTAQALAEHLDALSGSDRLTQTMALNRASQAKLFDIVEGARRMTLEDLAPAATQPLTGIRHEGRNSLPTFSRFAKVFAVPDEVAKVATERWGFNDSGFTVNTFVGPGYFVVNQDGGDVLVDYTQYPPKPHLGGPKILSNSSRLSRFVFNNTKDRVRGVSKHVSIGRAWRGAKRLDNWFVLCRTA